MPQHVVEAARQFGNFAAAVHRQPRRQPAIAQAHGAHGDHGLAQGFGNAARDEGGKEQQNRPGRGHQQDMPPDLLAHGGVHIVKVNARSDQPAPGRKFLDIGKFRVTLRGDASALRRLWPVIRDIALPALIDHLGESDEQIFGLPGGRECSVCARPQARRAVELRHVQHLPIKLRHGRVHDHPGKRRPQIIEPEVLLFVIAHGLDGAHGRRLSRRLGHVAFLLQRMKVGQHTETAFHQLPGFLLFFMPQHLAQQQDVNHTAHHDATNQQHHNRPDPVAHAQTVQKGKHYFSPTTTR